MKKLLLAMVLVALGSAFYLRRANSAELADVIATSTNKGLTEFTGAVAAVGFTDKAQSANPPAPFTVFVPSNEAFTKAYASNKVAKTPESLKPIVKFHVVPGKKLSKEQLVPGQLESIAGSKIEVLAGGQVKGAAETATVSESVECSNGFIHVINEVLTPTKE